MYVTQRQVGRPQHEERWPASAIKETRHRHTQDGPMTTTASRFGHRFEDLKIDAAPDGRALDSHLRGRLETSLGGDLSDLRVHTDPDADTLARGFQARAFTHGPDIFFRSGAYDPSSPTGLNTLAHEATHVLQQDSGHQNSRANHRELSVGDPHSRFEADAQQAATRCSLEIPAPFSPPLSTAVPAIQRIPDELDSAGGLPPNINPFGPTDLPPADPFAPTDLPPGGVPNPLNPTFPKPPGVPNIPEPPPGGFPQAPPSPATGASAGGGILDTIGSILGAIGGTIVDFFPPVPKSLFPSHGEEA